MHKILVQNTDPGPSYIRSFVLDSLSINKYHTSLLLLEIFMALKENKKQRNSRHSFWWYDNLSQFCGFIVVTALEICCFEMKKMFQLDTVFYFLQQHVALLE